MTLLWCCHLRKWRSITYLPPPGREKTLYQIKEWGVGREIFHQHLSCSANHCLTRSEWWKRTLSHITTYSTWSDGLHPSHSQWRVSKKVSKCCVLYGPRRRIWVRVLLSEMAAHIPSSLSWDISAFSLFNAISSTPSTFDQIETHLIKVDRLKNNSNTYSSQHRTLTVY